MVTQKLSANRRSRCPVNLLSAIGLFALCSWSAGAMAQMADAAFTVRDMRVEGLQRLSEGTVFNYLPINIGDSIGKIRVQEAIRALYSQGLFDNVELRRDGDMLIVAVRERPSIESFEIDGNKDIKTEDLTESLRSVGLAKGRTFDRSVLEEVTMFLRDQYYSRGKYGVQIETSVIDRPNNTVQVRIDVKEGDRAKVRQVNIVGNHEFSDRKIREDFNLDTANWLSWIRQDDRYEKQGLEGDLETLRSFYMDRGYADFDIASTQVAISPDKKDIYITITIREGERYTVSDVKLVGDMAVPEPILKALILAQPGTTFNQALLTQTSELMALRMGQEGYANAKIEPVWELDRDTREAGITFFVNPNSRVYVRNIRFNGVDEVEDEVLRREMRQLEGAYLSNVLVDRSKIRLQRLPYIEDVQISDTAVSGSPDLVDVDIDLKYRMPGQFSGGIGYSGAQKVILQGSIVHTNFLGSGNRVALDLKSSRFSKHYSLSHTDPARTIDGIRRTVTLTYRDITQFTRATSSFSTETLGATLDYGYPIGEFQTLTFGLSYQNAELLSSSRSTRQAQDWVRSNGNPFVVNSGRGGARVFGTDFDSVELLAGWIYDSRNRALFPTRGTRHQLFLGATIPGLSDVEYYTARYNMTRYQHLFGRWALRWNVDLGIGKALGDTTALPPYKQFFGGGPQSVRGFRESYLGPRDTRGRPYGGNMLVASQLELILPLPEKWARQARATLFYDIGNVFNTGEVKFFDKLGKPIDYDFAAGDLRSSVGLGVEWLAPLGLFRFSYAFPLDTEKGNKRFYGDELEEFQFTIGNAF